MSKANYTFTTSHELKPTPPEAPVVGASTDKEVVMSRRTALRTSVALGAAGLGLVTGKADASRADAELLALGEKIDPLFAKIKAAQTRAWEGRDRIENVLDTRRLAPDGTERWPSYDRGWWTKAEVEQSLSVEGEIERADAEFQKAEADLEILGKEEEALAQALFRTKATTIEGVAVKARAAAYLNEDMWGVRFDDLDWEQQYMRAAIDAIFEIGRQTLRAATFRLI